MKIDKKLLDLKLSEEETVRIQEIVDQEMYQTYAICFACMIFVLLFWSVA
jgi:hypothetical protein